MYPKYVFTWPLLQNNVLAKVLVLQRMRELRAGRLPFRISPHFILRAAALNDQLRCWGPSKHRQMSKYFASWMRIYGKINSVNIDYLIDIISIFMTKFCFTSIFEEQSKVFQLIDAGLTRIKIPLSLLISNRNFGQTIHYWKHLKQMQSNYHSILN